VQITTFDFLTSTFHFLPQLFGPFFHFCIHVLIRHNGLPHFQSLISLCFLGEGENHWCLIDSHSTQHTLIFLLLGGFMRNNKTKTKNQKKKKYCTFSFFFFSFCFLLLEGGEERGEKTKVKTKNQNKTKLKTFFCFSFFFLLLPPILS